MERKAGQEEKVLWRARARGSEGVEMVQEIRGKGDKKEKDFNGGHQQAGHKEKIRGMLQDGVGETQDRKE